MADKKFKVKNGLELNRVDSSNEGGEIAFNRASDNSTYWYIDVFGNTSTPSLRFIEDTNARFQIGSGGVLLINGSAGTSGQVLTSGGSGAAPTWTTVSTGGYTTTATAAGTTTLTSSSTFLQFFTGTSTQTIVLPVASTMTLGQQFQIHNNSTGALTVNSSGSNAVVTIDGGESVTITCILTSGTTAASWDVEFDGASTNTGTGALVYATNPILTTPQISAIELGHASDTTIARVSAGVVSIEGVNIVTTSSTDTLTNKTLTTPVLSGTASGTTAGRLGYLSGVLSFGDGTSQRTVVTTDNTQTLTNKTLTTPNISSISNTGTLTLPTSTDTLVGRATTDTLSNKTLTAPVLNGGSGTTAGALGYSSGNGGEIIYGDGAAQKTLVSTTSTQTLTNKTLTTPAIGSGGFTIAGTSGTITVQATSTASGTLVLPATGTSDTVVARNTTDTLTNKTLTSPSLTTPAIGSGGFTIAGSSSGTTTINTVAAASGTITVPAGTDTLVGRATTDTLTNKTLTAARITSGSHIADSNGNELILFPAAVASAVNEITVSNAATGVAPSITASGGDLNMNLNLRAKGTGTVNVGSTGLSVSGSSSGSTALVTAAAASGTLTIPSATDQLVARATTDTLTNKTISGASNTLTVRLANDVTGTLPVANGGTGLTALGTSLQVLRVNSGGTALEYATISAGSGDVVAANNNAFTGANTFTNSTGQIFRRAANQDGVLVRGSGAGTGGWTVELVPASLSASVVLTLPAATDQLVGRATTDTLTNKTLTSPTLTTPVLGTPSSGTLTNCTGLPVSGITASTTTALGVGSIELGHATDTTIARSSAGVVTIEGVTVATASNTLTLTNKRVAPRTTAASNPSPLAPNYDNDDVYVATGISAARTINSPTGGGTRYDGQRLTLRLKDDNGASAPYALTWGADYETAANGYSLPTTTTKNKWIHLGFIWNATDSKWQLIASHVQGQ